MPREWNRPSEETCVAAERLVRDERMPRPVAVTLVRRGLDDADVRERFLTPSLSRLADPASLPDLDRAVDRIWRAVDAGEPILVHGDYDVDGITGCAFLTRMLRVLGGRVEPFVPTRDEGYGLGEAGIRAARAADAAVVITVDCGTSSHAEIRELAEHGIDVVVLDHHEPGDTLPEAAALVNPLRAPDSPFRSLSAVGVAAKFIHAMAARRPGSLAHDEYREGLQLVALGTVADLVPLTGENRILVAYGLRRLSQSKWVGLQALKATARLARTAVTASDVAFQLAPRLNAVGRMGSARDALALLLTADPLEAYRLADLVERMNESRRRADEQVLADAVEVLRRLPELPPVLVLWSEGWPVGVIGIAASRLVDRFHRPVFMIALEGEIGRGSARSPAGFPLPAALAACADLLVTHGGHAQAAGFTIRRDRAEAFRERLERLGAEADLTPAARPWDLDGIVDLSELSTECVAWLERLEPFGNGNPEPLFGAERVEVAELPTVVGGRHLRLTLRAGGSRIRAIAFNQGDRVKELDRGQRVGAVFHAGFDAWRGNREVQLVVKDIRTG